MSRQTWVGSDLVADVLLNDIPENDAELYTRLGLLEDEVHAARDTEATLLAKETEQDTLTATVTNEVVAARSGKASLLAKQQEQDAQIAAAQVMVTTSFPDQTGKAGFTMQTDGAMPEWVDARVPIPVIFAYEDRGDLRTTVRTDKTLAVIEGLGLFAFKEGSDEPDDDESCFATSTGRWLLEAPHWDVIDMWNLPEVESRISEIERIDSSLSELDSRLSEVEEYVSTVRVLYGAATCAITSVATATSTAFTGTVTGAAVGDRVLVVPPGQLGSTAENTGRLSFHAFVSAADTVSVYLCNASAATATTNTTIRTAWPVMVFKEV